MLIATVLIAAMGSLAACEHTGEASRPGSIKLTLNFPSFTGAETVTKLNATLEKADRKGTPVTLDKTARDFSDSEIVENTKTTTLTFDSVPSGQYTLKLIFYRDKTVAALCSEGVIVRPGEETNKWQGGDGGTYSIRTFSRDEFRSMNVAASFVLKNSDGTVVPLSMIDPMPISWEVNKNFVRNGGKGMQLEISLHGGAGTSLLAVTLNREDKLSLFSSENGSSSIPVYTGTLDIGTGEALIWVEAQAPDRATTVSYTISQSP
jgi:hypothetical protein